MPSLDKPYSYRWPISIGLVLVAAYTLYVFEQYRDLHDLNQRELAMAAQEVRAAVENAVGTVDELIEGGDATRNFVCDFDSDQPYLTLDPKSGSCKTVKPGGQAKLTADPTLQIAADKAVFSVGVDAILGEMAFPEAFRLVFLANKDGKTLYQEAPGPRRWLRSLRWSDLELRARNPAAAGPIAIRDVKDLTGGKPVNATTRLPADLAGDSYQVYLQPVTVKGMELLLGGVVPTRELFRRALRVDTYFAAAMALVLLAGFLGIPFVKLWSLNRRERFRLADVHLLYLSTAALLSLLTYAIVGAEGYAQYRATADTGLRDLAGRLASNFLREVDASLKHLTASDAAASHLDRHKPEADWFKDKRVPPPSMPPVAPNVYFEQLAWIGPDGKQVWKVTADKTAELVNVPNRPYVRMVRDRSSNLYRLGAGPDFYIGPNRSITDGQFYTFLSTPSSIGAGYIAVATLKLVSVDRQPLPAGYGFAVINREGTILYHSDARLSLRENLLAEVGEAAEFRSHLIAQSEDPNTQSDALIASSYRERPHRFFIAPLAGVRRAGGGPSSLYVVTFRDTSGEVATFAHVFLLSLGPLASLLVFLAAALWVVERVSRGKAVAGSCPRADRLGTWLWPQHSVRDLYRRFSIVLAILFAAMVAACCLGSWAVWLAAPPIVLIAGTSLHLRGGDPARAGPRRRQSEPVWHVAQWMLTLICLVILPSAALIRVVLEHEYGKLVKTEEVWIKQQETDAGLAARASATDNSYSEAIQNHVAALRPVYQVASPAPFDREPGERDALSRFVAEQIGAIGHWLPITNDSVARYRHQGFDVSYAPPGHFGWGWPAALVWPCFGLLLYAMFKWVRWNARNLFLADVELAPGEAVAPAKENWIDTQLARGNTNIEVTADPAVSWDKLKTDDDRFLLMQIAAENLANPGQRKAVERLLAEGYVCLNPDLQPAPALCERVREEAARPAARSALRDWEQVDAADSWRYVRTVAFAGLAALAVLLFQSEIAALAGTVAAGLTNLSKLRDAVGGWFPSAKKAEGK